MNAYRKLVFPAFNAKDRLILQFYTAASLHDNLDEQIEETAINEPCITTVPMDSSINTLQFTKSNHQRG